MEDKKRSPYNQKKFLLVFAIIVAILAGLNALCNFDVAPYHVEIQNAKKPAKFILHRPAPADTLKVAVQAKEPEPITMSDTMPEPLTQDTVSANTMDNKEVVERPLVKRAGSKMWSYKDCFNDVQDTQIVAAEANGIRPVTYREELQTLVENSELVDIRFSPFYVIDELTSSVPLLVPKAQDLLNTIAINFIDSLHSKGMKPYLPIITSVLRTTNDVRKLQHGNKNATENSCHCYGTTIDITYRRFMPLTGSFDAKAATTLHNEDLKFVLAEVLYDLRLAGHCYVKYEYKQACFHLTVR